jgi:hypothetical protein
MHDAVAETVTGDVLQTGAEWPAVLEESRKKGKEKPDCGLPAGKRS